MSSTFAVPYHAAEAPPQPAYLMVVRVMVVTEASGPCGPLGPGNTFQKRSVSSPAPVTIVCPSGDTARYSTRRVCPVVAAVAGGRARGRVNW